MINRAIREHADEARHAAVDGNPVVHRRSIQTGGVCYRGYVQQQIRRAANAACSTIAFSMLAEVRMSRILSPRSSSCWSARAERRAMSSHTGCPDGERAECGSESPKASLTTCAVAAVPRNWQPPPGEPHARQPVLPLPGA